MTKRELHAIEMNLIHEINKEKKFSLRSIKKVLEVIGIDEFLSESLF